MRELDALDKAELSQKTVTLNGKPAVIVGYACPFATVATLDGTMRVNYSWDAIKRIVSNGGNFEVGI